MLKLVAGTAAAVMLLGGLSACSKSAVHVTPSIKNAISELVSPPTELADGVTKAAVACLARYGYSIPYDPAVRLAPQNSITGVGGLFASPDEAKRYGYNSTVKSDAEDPIEAYRDGLSAGAARQLDRRYLGGPDASPVSITLTSGAKASMSGSGCLATANREIYGSVKSALQISQFVNEVYAAVDTQAVIQAVRGALPAYEKCMKRHDYHVNGLNADKLAKAKFGQYRRAGDPPEPAEAEMAVQDAECQEASGLVHRANAAFYKGAAAWVANNQQMILARQATLRTAEANAKRVLER